MFFVKLVHSAIWPCLWNVSHCPTVSLSDPRFKGFGYLAKAAPISPSLLRLWSSSVKVMSMNTGMLDKFFGPKTVSKAMERTQVPCDLTFTQRINFLLFLQIIYRKSHQKICCNSYMSLQNHESFTLIVSFMNTIASVVKLWTVNQKTRLWVPHGKVNRDYFTIGKGVRNCIWLSQLGKRMLTKTGVSTRETTLTVHRPGCTPSKNVLHLISWNTQMDNLALGVCDPFHSRTCPLILILPD